MAKNILIFSDGTGQAGGLKPDQRLSNVYKLFRATRVGPDSCIDPQEQVAFYDPGLGTASDEGSVPVAALQSVRKMLSSALGIGISRNITDCYEAILQHYEPGDRIYLFGFSRGAYTARCVAGVLNLCGVPTSGPNGSALPRRGPSCRAIAEEAVTRVYEHGAGRDRAQFEAEREEQGRRFREKYQSDLNGKANVVPYFIGVFDTVASLGAAGARKWLLRFGLAVIIAAAAFATAGLVAFATGASFGWTVGSVFVLMIVVTTALSLRSSLRIIRDFPEKGQLKWHLAKWESGFYDRFLDPRVCFARHALSIDETRSDFARVPWGLKNTKQDRIEGEPECFRQIWFAGNHSDIGGSYPEDESRLSDISLQWMLEQTQELPHSISVDKSKLNLFPYANGMQHCEVKNMLDGFPRWWSKGLRFTWSEHPRSEARGAPLHQSVHERFKFDSVLQHSEVGPYRPQTLREDATVISFYAEAVPVLEETGVAARVG